jgi:2,4-dienoyl-CoA reductase-like NADH-dependent reductase (Old Yellow Enzyme family)/thioredoxin reductase
VGLVTVEQAAIHPLLPHIRNALGVFSDSHISGLRKLVDCIHAHGAKAALQIGLYFRPEVSGFPRYAVSRSSGAYPDDVIEISQSDIEHICGLFGRAAERVVDAGFDAVEVHACHGCLVSEFLSPYWNQRADEYGGDAGRHKLAIQILNKMRRVIGSDFPIIFRIPASEFDERGLKFEDAVSISLALEREGVTAISLSGGLGHINHVAIPPSDIPRGLLLPLASEIKRYVKVPVIAGNSLTPDMAEDALRKNMIDLVGLGRPLIADPEWARKVACGEKENIRPCIRCNQGCFGGLRYEGIVGCLVNPEAGRETGRRISPASKKLKVVVIGGGVAGCEAARVARLRGHHVTLYEKEGRLGGQWRLASQPPKKNEFIQLIDFYERELNRLGVEVVLNRQVLPEELATMEGDLFIMALGSIPKVPDIPGKDLPHVYLYPDVLSGRVQITQGPVVIVGGGATGLETADYVSEKGFETIVVEMLVEMARDIRQGIGVRELLLRRLEEKRVRLLGGCKLIRIDPESVLVSRRPFSGDGEFLEIPARTVVLCSGNIRNSAPDRVPFHLRDRVFCVGDCVHPRNALVAISEAYDVAARV